MTASRFVVFSVMVVLLAAITLSEGVRVGPQKCCFAFSDRPLKLKQVTNYNMTSKRCSKEAVVFTTRKGFQVCARPTIQWVQELMKNFDIKRFVEQGSL